jgi:hypothetical protein
LASTSDLTLNQVVWCSPAFYNAFEFMKPDQRPILRQPWQAKCFVNGEDCVSTPLASTLNADASIEASGHRRLSWRVAEQPNVDISRGVSAVRLKTWSAASRE